MRGVQLFPDRTKICLIMFADDVTCVSDTMNGLQRQLNLSTTFSYDYKLDVNTEKKSYGFQERWKYI